MQERVTRETTGGSSGVKLGLRTIAVDDVVAGVARIGGIGDTKLSVVEDVIGFGTELDIETL